jgi:hypothetical protein
MSKTDRQKSLQRRRDGIACLCVGVKAVLEDDEKTKQNVVGKGLPI